MNYLVGIVPILIYMFNYMFIQCRLFYICSLYVVMRNISNLQLTCLDKISSLIYCKSDVDELPLPDLMKDKLRLYSYQR